MYLLTTLIITVFYFSFQTEGQLDNGAGFILSCDPYFPTSTVTFTVQAPGAGTYIVGFSVTKPVDYRDVDIIISYEDDSGMDYAYDFNTNSGSNEIVDDDSDRVTIRSVEYDSMSQSTTLSFDIPIISDDDVDLNQCVYVVWAYSTTVKSASLQFDDDSVSKGVFQDQICSLALCQPGMNTGSLDQECPIKNSSACTSRISKIFCRALQLLNPAGSTPQSCL